MTTRIVEPEDASDPGKYLRMVHYSQKHIPDPYGGLHKTSWQHFHTVRNAVVRACSRHGSIGPMGECPIRSDQDSPDYFDKKWPRGTDKPDFFVIDEQLNHERYIYVELLRPKRATAAWLHEIVKTLHTFAGWGCR